MKRVESMDYQKIREIFDQANFVKDLGIQIHEIRPEECETHLDITSRHLQQTGVVHAGVIATLADHTAGGAAGTVLKENEFILTVEFKINLLRPADARKLKCISKIIKSGRTLIFAESEVFAYKNQKETLVSKAMVTLAVLKKT